jgi:hypothetical protein
MGIFKGKINLQETIDSVFKGVDQRKLTNEEIVEYSIKAADLNLEFVKATNAESTPRSISRRIIAILVIGQYCLAFNVGLVGMASGWYEGKEILIQATSAFEWSVISIIIFYFGNHLLSSVIPKFGNKKKP